MAAASNPVPAIVPNPQTPKLLGILSIVFASILLMCDVVGVAAVALGPMLGKLMETSVKTQQDAVNAQLKAEKDGLDRREKAAKTDDEKAKIQAERASLAARPNPNVTMNFNSMDQFRNPTMMRVSYFQLLSGIPLNLLMLASGIGLIGLKGWGRKLSLWVAGIKIVRIVVLFYLSIALVLPITLAAQKKQFEQMDAQMKANGGGGAAPFSMNYMAKVSAASSYSLTVIYSLLAPIFPVILLVALNRPRALAAFELAAKPKPAAASDWEEMT